jgi:NAD(P)-dependent dehydrogenase (short-subunit alcohol dehydrogenase family)
MKNKIVLITGATDGIGKQTALEAARRGARLIIHGRNEQRTNETLSFIKKETGIKDIFGITADFSSLKKVSETAENIYKIFKHIDILINNVGLISSKKIMTEDGFETTFQVNYLAGFLLTQKILSLLEKSKKARILNVSSMIHAAKIDFDDLNGEKSFDSTANYALSKLCNILFTYSLAEKCDSEKITVNCLHPGVINTKLLNTSWSGGQPVAVGAQNLLYLSEVPLLETMTGHYFENGRPMQSSPISYDKTIQKQLWNLSINMVNKYL